MNREQRTISRPIELRADGEDGPGVITGYAAVFYRQDDPGTQYELWAGAYERIMPGAFDRAISEGDDVAALFNHDPSRILGRAKSGTLKLTVDNVGLRYEITPADTSVYRDLREHLARGDIDGSSFSFRIDGEQGQEWRKEGDAEIREVKSVQLFDVGPVTYPAYAATSSEGRSEARSAHDRWTQDEQAKEKDQKELDAFLLKVSIS